MYDGSDRERGEKKKMESEDFQGRQAGRCKVSVAGICMQKGREGKKILKGCAKGVSAH